jgi:hypothetical protein
MTTSNLKWILGLVFALVVFESCETDDDQFNTVLNESIVSDETTQLIVEWNGLFLKLDRYTFGMRPNATARALAYMHLAAYETVVDDMTDFTSNTIANLNY